MKPIVHEVSYGPFTKTTYTLTPERLHVETRGGIGGASANIPVAGMSGFFAVSRKARVVGPRSAIVRASQEIAKAGGQLIVAWGEGGIRKKKIFNLDIEAPSFVALLAELQRMRPDASLLHLPSAEAHRRLGVWSQEKRVKVTMAIVLAILFVGGAILAVIGGGQNRPARPAPPAPTRAGAR